MNTSMKYVVIIGCPGAGKSTFARKLAAKTGLSLHYIDMIWHKADRTVVGRDEFDRQLDTLVKEDEWILEFPRNVAPEIEHLLKGFDKTIVRFHLREETDKFLETWK